MTEKAARTCAACNPEIGSVDPHAFKIPARRAEISPLRPDFHLIFTLNQHTGDFTARHVGPAIFPVVSQIANRKQSLPNLFWRERP
jgi:hypothetical protein